LAKAGTETDTTPYARRNPLFQVFFFCFFFFHANLLMEPLVKGLVTPHDAIASWNLSTTTNFHVKGISSRNKKHTICPNLKIKNQVPKHKQQLIRNTA